MSVQFYPLTIKDVTKETNDCIVVSFDVPESVQDKFTYVQGQNLTIKASINNNEVRRTYSLCSSPMDNEWKVAIKKISGGLFSAFAHQDLKKGDILEVMQPVGRFNSPLHAGNKKNYLAIAAGSGITPVLSIIKTTLATELNSRFTLIYGNRDRNSIIFFEELEGLKNKYLQRFNFINILSRERTDAPVFFGRIDEAKLNELTRLVNFASFDECFICGPEEMIFASRDFLVGKGIDSRHIHFELFNTSSIKPIRKSLVDVTDQAASRISIIADGRTLNFNLPFASEQSVLDAAIKEGADLPFACKGGVCCTCKAKLLSGEVEMDVHWGLEEEEIEQGYILTCQSHPRTAEVMIDFDIK